VEKRTEPTPLAGVTATEKVTLVPTVTFVAEGVIVIELPVVREAAQAMARLLPSTEPSPATRLYPVVESALVELNPKTPAVGQITSVGWPEGVPFWQ
jgi:hypothetical protein